MTISRFNPNRSFMLSMHPNILSILFNHKNEILKKLSDLRGLHYIDHVSLILITPQREIIVLSITPSVEFNLIIQDLWQYDMSFNPIHFTTDKLLFWDTAYLEDHQIQLKFVKEIQHGFAFGFNLIRKIHDFHLIYSFATRKDELELRNYYQSIVPDLYSLGDYGYKQLREIFEHYTANSLPPCAVPNQISPMHNRLRLVVNNK